MKPTLVLITHVLNNAIVDGFVPAARAMNCDVVLLTDHGPAHLQALPDIQVHECDVFNPIAMADLLSTLNITPSAVFSNSDHLQTSTALLADLLGLPSKPWKICYHAKNKHWMRKRLESLKLPSVWSRMASGKEVANAGWPFPLVAKPVQGVASIDVVRVDTADELNDYLSCLDPHHTVLLEEFMEGPLVTLETLGDGQKLHVIGGFDVGLSSAPYFIETSAIWNGPHTRQWRTHMLHTLQEFGVGLGACHSEFIVTPRGPVLVEINYRSIGDNREFLLDQLVDEGWFTSILRTHLGMEVSEPTLRPTCARIDYLVAQHDGTVRNTPVIENSIHMQYRPIRKDGDAMRISHSNKDYIGVFTLLAGSEGELEELRTHTLNNLVWSVQ